MTASFKTAAIAIVSILAAHAVVLGSTARLLQSRADVAMLPIVKAQRIVVVAQNAAVKARVAQAAGQNVKG